MPPSAVEERVSGRDAWRLLRYYQRQPWGPERGELQNGMLMSLIDRKLGGKSKPIDFMPFQRPPRPTPEQLHKKAMWYTRVMQAGGG